MIVGVELRHGGILVNMSMVHLLLKALLLSLTLLEDNLFHLVDGHRTFDINPFLLDYVLVAQFEDYIYRTDVVESHKTETAWLLCSLVLQNDHIFNCAKILKIAPKRAQFEIMRQSTNKHLPKLRFDLISRIQRLLPEAIQGVQLLLILLYLLFGSFSSHRTLSSLLLVLHYGSSHKLLRKICLLLSVDSILEILCHFFTGWVVIIR